MVLYHTSRNLGARLVTKREKVLLQSNICLEGAPKWSWSPLLRHKSKAVSNCHKGGEDERLGPGQAGPGREGRSHVEGKTWKEFAGWVSGK